MTSKPEPTKGGAKQINCSLLLRANTMNSSSHHGGRQMFVCPQKSIMPISSAIWNQAICLFWQSHGEDKRCRLCTLVLPRDGD